MELRRLDVPVTRYPRILANFRYAVQHHDISISLLSKESSELLKQAFNLSPDFVLP